MLCHCIGGVIPGCDVILDSSSDGYSCIVLQFIGSVCFINKLVHSLIRIFIIEISKVYIVSNSDCFDT